MTNVNQYAAGDSDIRPWGRWEVLAVGEGFIVKKIDVKPGATLSLQSHEHRSEHWTILKGKAAVTLGGDVVEHNEHGSVFIPAQVKHRVKNIGQEILSFVELQTGAVLDENDITRFEDQYGRS